MTKLDLFIGALGLLLTLLAIVMGWNGLLFGGGVLCGSVALRAGCQFADWQSRQ